MTEKEKIYRRIQSDVEKRQAIHGKDCQCQVCLFPKTALKDFAKKIGGVPKSWLKPTR